MKIDIFPHLVPKKYQEAFLKKLKSGVNPSGLDSNSPLEPRGGWILRLGYHLEPPSV